MSPAENGPVVLEVFCSAARDAHLCAVVRLRPTDRHRVLHPVWKRVSARAEDVLEGSRLVDLDDEDRRHSLAYSGELAGAGEDRDTLDLRSRTPHSRAMNQKMVAGMQEKPWIFCKCGQNLTVTATWLRLHAPSEVPHKPRRVAAPSA